MSEGGVSSGRHSQSQGKRAGCVCVYVSVCVYVCVCVCCVKRSALPRARLTSLSERYLREAWRGEARGEPAGPEAFLLRPTTENGLKLLGWMGGRELGSGTKPSHTIIRRPASPFLQHYPTVLP